MDYRWLQPTSANLSLLQLHIPATFRHVAAAPLTMAAGRGARAGWTPPGHRWFHGTVGMAQMIARAFADEGTGDRRRVGALAELAALGPYFAVDAREPGSPMPAGWQPLGSLVGSPGALSAAIGQVRERLAAAGGRRAADIEFRWPRR